MAMPVYKRVLVKLSGEALQGKQGFGIDPETVDCIANELREICGLRVETSLVIGGGNIFRGSSAVGKTMGRVAADHMGMLATVINGLALQEALEKKNIHTRLMTAIEMHQVAEPFIRRRAIRHLEKGRLVLFVGGTGNPYFSTDTAAALRAMEINAEVILKATKVDGIFDADPEMVKEARKIDTISHLDVIARGLKVMDTTAISLCMDNKLPIVVFNLNVPGNMKRVILGDTGIGSRVVV